MKFALFSVGSILLPLVTSVPLLNVDIRITDDAQVGNSPEVSSHLQHVLNPKPDTSFKTKSEQIPGWAYFDGTRVQARIHGNTFWNIKGTLDKAFPQDEFLFDPVILTLNHPLDYEGSFNGTVGRGEINLTWAKSGATIKGRSPIGDFQIAGTSKIDWSP